MTGDDVEVTMLPDVGARIHRLRAFGHDVLRTPDDADIHRHDPFFWGSYVMAPWCNRVDAAPVTVAGRRIDLSSNFADGTAIHGEVYDRPWHDDGAGMFRIGGGGPGWPWRYEVVMRVTVSGSAVRLGLALTNLDDGAMPGGVGIHPWWRRPLLVAVPARSVFSPNDASPARPQPVTGDTDLRPLAAMTRGLDATWADLTDPVVQLHWPTLDVGATLTTSPGVFVVAASPTAVDADALEPETHAPQGLRRLVNGEPGAMTMVEPGANLGLEVELAFRRLGRPSTP